MEALLRCSAVKETFGSAAALNSIVMRAVILLIAFTSGLFAQKYAGPRPPKPDIPYLLHADTLVPTEVGEAKEESKKDDTVAWVAGASSSARTPIPEPIFLMEADKLQPDKIELYRLDVKNGRREVTLPNSPKRRGKGSKAVRLGVTRLEGRLYRIEASEILEPGEYALSPSGSNQVFCFQVR
jgi:hypothetical protein